MKVPRYIGLLLLILSTAAYLLVPNHARALTPGLFGTTKIAPEIYTDAPEQAAALLDLVDKGKTRAAVFFGKLRATPRIVICTTKDCQNRFSFQSLGLAIGRQGILIGPVGMNRIIDTAFQNTPIRNAIETELGTAWP